MDFSIEQIKYKVIPLLVVFFIFSNYLWAQPNYPFGIQVNSSVMGHQDSPEIAVNSNGTVLTVFESTVLGDNDENIFAVSYDRKTFKEFYQTGKTTDTPSLEAFPNSDKFVIAWEQNTELYFAIVSCKDGNEDFVVGPKPIRDDYTLKGKRPDVAISADGSYFAIAWQYYYDDDVVFHLFDSLGTPIGNTNKVSALSKRRSQIGIKFWPDSILAATWHTKDDTYQNKETDIWFQHFDCKDIFNGGQAANLFETEKRANGNLDLDYANYIQEYPEIDIFNDGRFAIMWQDFPYNDGGDGTDGDGKGAYFRIFNRDGTPQSDDIQMADHTRSFQKDADMRIRQSDNTIHFVYEDAYESTDSLDWLAYPTYRVFNDSGIPLDSSVELSDKSYGTDCRIAITEPDAQIPNLVLWVWETKDKEDYDGSGRAIIFRDSSSIATDIEYVTDSNIVPNQIELSQNYPNPFNPKTVISYQLSAISQVNLTIYNMLGQKVQTLVNKRQNPGNYKIEWNAGGFTSGLYYYQLNTGAQSQVRKMMLLK